MDKPRLLFLALYSHHYRYFKLLIGQEQPYEGVLQKTISYFKPLSIKNSPSTQELEDILRYSYKRSVNRLKHLFSKVLYGIHRFRARIYFSNYLQSFKHTCINGVVLWNGQNLPLAAAAVAARRLGLKTFYLENGPLPLTTMVDTKGINYENSLPRDADFYRKVMIDNQRLNQLIDTPLVPRRPKRKETMSETVQLPERFYFLPFQTYSDTQILLFSPWISNMSRLVRLVSEALTESTGEDIVLVAKEHPSCGKRYDTLQKEMARKGVIFANGIATSELIKKSLGVITINSSVGIEALMMDRPVLTLGQAFYNIQDLVLHADDGEELREGLGQLHKYRPDPSVREGFLYFLRYHYLVEGTHQNPNTQHISAMGQRIYELVNKV